MSDICCLGSKFHKNVKDERQLGAITPCPLFGKETYFSDGMKTSGQICVHCCIEISKVFSNRRDMFLAKTIDPQDEKGNPDIVVQFLPEELVKYAEIVLKTHKSFSKAERECVSCAAIAWREASRKGAPAIKQDKATEMGYCH